MAAETPTLTVAERIVRWEPGVPTLTCPCKCSMPEIAVAHYDDGDVRYCGPCLQAGYACRLMEVSHAAD